MEFLIIVMFIILGIRWAVDELTKQSLKTKMKKAQKDGDLAEFNRLNVLIEQHQRKKNKPHKVSPDQRYIDAMFTLDAAEQGYFWPGGERVFDELDESYDDVYFE